MAVSTQNAGSDRSWRIALLFAGVLGLFLLTCAGNAEAAPGCTPEGAACPPQLDQIGSNGAGAGQLRAISGGVAADPANGHIFVGEGDRINEFDSAGDFIKAWGWGVVDGSPELQVCTTGTGCQAGTFGEGVGQIGISTGVEIDGGGNVWVLEYLSHRLQKFSPDGEFLLMAGGEVNETRVQEREDQEAKVEPVTVTEAEENLCTAASGDQCGTGIVGTGNGEFGIAPNSIALGPGGVLYVGDKGRIQKFDESGSWLGEIPLAGAGLTESLAVDPTGRIYVITEQPTELISSGNFSKPSSVVREIGPAGEEIRRLAGTWEGRKTPRDPLAVSTDSAGNIYVSGTVIYPLPVEEGKEPKFEEIEEIVAFEPSGARISFEPDRAGFGASGDDTELRAVANNVVGDGSGAPGEVMVGHFFPESVSKPTPITYVRTYGIPYETTPGPPTIEAQFATSATTTEASLEALINPHFTTDTTFQVQYGLEECSSGGCTNTLPVAPRQLGGGAVSSPQKTGPVVLTGLSPGATYHYRFTAENEAGGPVVGSEAEFRTFTAPASTAPCPNDAYRTGAAAQLPDCRAYEMVSPVDKGGGEILPLTSVLAYPAEINQGSPDGGAFSYSTYRAYGEAEAAPYTSQYLSRRDAEDGWSAGPISPPREGVIVPTLDTQFRAFSSDLSMGWLVTDSEPVLAAGGLPGYRNLYRRDNLLGQYEAQCSVTPPGSAPIDFNLEPQGHSADGSHVLIRANAKLHDDAASGDVLQLYECVGGDELRFVSVLPNGNASASGGSAGTGEGGLIHAGRENTVDGAISDDGTRIFWTAAPNGPGPLLMRLDGVETVEIASSNARFRGANPDGTRVVYTRGEDLLEASVGADSAVSTEIASEVEGVMGLSEDTELVYFVSREDLDGGGSAQAGKPNLYLYRAQPDSFSFIATLGGLDAREFPQSEETSPTLTPIAVPVYNRSSRVTADGLHAAFTSSAPLTGVDNIDQASGEPDAQVFHYDAQAGELVCVSCSPNGARPKGVNAGDPLTPFWAAAKIPGWENQEHASRALSDDGNRVIFESADRLALADTNGQQDVYQWEAVGSGTCSESAPAYSPFNAGCVSLISSGKSPRPSELLDASANGSDVFFKTASSLWPGDPGFVDVYDARVGGGFAPPPPPTPPCEGEGCRPPASAPEVAVPSSSTFKGTGNVVDKPRKRSTGCRKGTHRVKRGSKVKCAKNRKAKRSASGAAR